MGISGTEIKEKREQKEKEQEKQKEVKPQSEISRVHTVVVKGIDIPFWDLLIFLIKLALASIPAAIIVGGITSLVMALLGGLFGGLFGVR